MQIHLLSVGRPRNTAFRDGAAEYLKRLKHYATIQSVAVREEPGHRSPDEILRKEADRLERALPQDAYVVALDRSGDMCDSRQLAERLSQLGLLGRSRAVFLVGGPLGLSEELMARADWRLSLSPMTFPHELARLVLLEQLYRAFTIIRGEQYHK